MDLEIILRTCDRQDVHPERGERFIKAEKPELIRRAFLMLLNSINWLNERYKVGLKVIDDGSSFETLCTMQKSADSKGIPVQIERLKEAGFNKSALRQFELARDSTAKWVYTVEDDYLHWPEALEQMLLMADKFHKMTGQDQIAIRPDDCPFTYAPNNPRAMQPSVLVLGNDRHWRTQTQSHNTLLTRPSVLQDYWHLFASLALYYKQLAVNEDKTINLIWEKVPLFSPIPGLAMHCSQNNPPPFQDYMKLWESVK